MHIKAVDSLREINSTVLRDVTGGAAAAIPTPNMGAPKYSAAWWDLVRASGNFK